MRSPCARTPTPSASLRLPTLPARSTALPPAAARAALYPPLPLPLSFPSLRQRRFPAPPDVDRPPPLFTGRPETLHEAPPLSPLPPFSPPPHRKDRPAASTPTPRTPSRSRARRPARGSTTPSPPSSLLPPPYWLAPPPLLLCYAFLPPSPLALASPPLPLSCLAPCPAPCLARRSSRGRRYCKKGPAGRRFSPARSSAGPSARSEGATAFESIALTLTFPPLALSPSPSTPLNTSQPACRWQRAAADASRSRRVCGALCSSGEGKGRGGKAARAPSSAPSLPWPAPSGGRAPSYHKRWLTDRLLLRSPGVGLTVMVVGRVRVLLVAELGRRRAGLSPDPFLPSPPPSPPPPPDHPRPHSLEPAGRRSSTRCARRPSSCVPAFSPPRRHPLGARRPTLEG